VCPLRNLGRAASTRPPDHVLDRLSTLQGVARTSGGSCSCPKPPLLCPKPFLRHARGPVLDSSGSSGWPASPPRACVPPSSAPPKASPCLPSTPGSAASAPRTPTPPRRQGTVHACCPSASRMLPRRWNSSCRAAPSSASPPGVLSPSSVRWSKPGGPCRAELLARGQAGVLPRRGR